MGKSKKVALHRAHVASTESRGLTGAHRDLRGLGLTNWHTANTANNIAILHQMSNGQDKDLVKMPQNELWGVIQQTGALVSITSSPCCSSESTVPQSWTLQTWIEMATYGIGTSAMIASNQILPNCLTFFSVSYDVFRLKFTYKASHAQNLANETQSMQNVRLKASYDTEKNVRQFGRIWFVACVPSLENHRC